jgi:hypothetical protein
MQWHPIFAHLLRPLVESHFEVRTNQPVGDLPRVSDILLLHKTAAGPPPFKGLWRRLTTWNVLEYKGPTVSARFDELHDLLELGLGIHRRLNELQVKQRQPQLDYPDVSFWYLVNHLGQRFLADLPRYLPGVRQAAEGIWQAAVHGHSVLLVSVQELAVERDSLALHTLAGVPDEAKGTIVEVLKAEPALWPNYQAWLSLREPDIWKEIFLMASQQDQLPKLDFGPLAEYFRTTDDPASLKSLLEAFGVKKIWAGLSPQQREELLRVAQEDKPGEPSEST